MLHIISDKSCSVTNNKDKVKVAEKFSALHSSNISPGPIMTETTSYAGFHSHLRQKRCWKQWRKAIKGDERELWICLAMKEVPSSPSVSLSPQRPLTQSSNRACPALPSLTHSLSFYGGGGILCTQFSSPSLHWAEGLPLHVLSLGSHSVTLVVHRLSAQVCFFLLIWVLYACNATTSLDIHSPDLNSRVMSWTSELYTHWPTLLHTQFLL